MNISKDQESRTTQRFSPPRTFAGVMGNALAGLGLKRQFDGWTCVDRWPEVVGDEIGQRTRAIRYEDGVLYVGVPDDAWRQELSMQLEAILDRLHKQPWGKAVKQIRLQRGNKRT